MVVTQWLFYSINNIRPFFNWGLLIGLSYWTYFLIASKDPMGQRCYWIQSSALRRFWSYDSIFNCSPKTSLSTLKVYELQAWALVSQLWATQNSCISHMSRSSITQYSRQRLLTLQESWKFDRRNINWTNNMFIKSNSTQILFKMPVNLFP